MNDFTKTINDVVFNFREVQEGESVIFLVFVDNQRFRMIYDEEGQWYIWQQVPAWIKGLEEALGDAIDEQSALS
jgi:hypothetical protein